MPGTALDKISLLSVFVESILWGIFLSLYGITIYLLVQKRSHITKYIPHLLAVTAMLVLCTMHVGLSFRRALDAFFIAPSPLVYFLDATTTTSRFKGAVHVIQILMSDLLIVSRSFLLWDKNYFVAILPCLLVVGTLVAGVGSLLVVSSPHPAPGLDADLQPWVIAILALTLATKAICLCLVAFRVRQIHASITSHVDRHITVYTALVVLVESGAAALLACLVLLPMYVAQRNAHYIVWDALSPVIGITFTTIIAGMTVNLANPSSGSPTVSIPRHTRYSVAALPRPPLPPKGGWNDYPTSYPDPSTYPEDSSDTSPTPTPPVLSRPASLHNVNNNNNNKSSGTLNMAIVI